MTTAAALIPPMPSTASADSAAARRAEPIRCTDTSGSSTHGSMTTGSISEDSGPISVSIRGASA